MSRDRSISRFTPAKRLPRGFTLIEMITSMIIMVVLLLACGSVVSLATYSVSHGAARATAQNQTGDAASQLTDDLNVAMNFTERTATSTTFTVPDRLNSGSPQTVRYAWVPTAGSPLTRQFNGGSVVPILANLQSLNLQYLTRLMGPTPPPIESIRFHHDTVLLGTAQNFKLDRKHWIAQCFVPTLPIGTTSWTLTRVQLMLQCATISSMMPVLVVMPDGNKLPNGAVLAQTNAYSTALSTSYEMLSVTFMGLGNLSPTQGLCIEVQYNNGSGSNTGTFLQYESASGSILSNASFSTTSNTGASWSSSGLTSCALMNVYGTVP
ncbi:MAG: prepilin-type N-terminal cleavage/methylation domain-containing protein [Planctomycetota bacterium]|nr:prepilin-type N-terminal cleavage/methylation domain-containing protein [Planctomycetota bacterium]